MAYFTVQTIRDLIFPPKPLICQHRLWKNTLNELRKRGRGNRESGGFLLGKRQKNTRVVKKFIPYDSIDPNSLQGAILFDGSLMDLVWEECRQQELEVIADVHTHPGGFGQSDIDQANPMIPERGHIAIIIPNFANRLYLPGQIGVYEFQGRNGWIDHSSAGSRFFSVRRFG